MTLMLTANSASFDMKLVQQIVLFGIILALHHVQVLSFNSNANVVIEQPVELLGTTMPSQFAEFSPLPPPYSGLSSYVRLAIPGDGCKPFTNAQVRLC
jgi:hypothetical protein